MWETIRSFFAPPIAADPAQSTTQLLWIVRLRWLAISAQLISIPVALEFEVLEPRLLPAFVAVIALLASWNIATWFTLQRGWQLQRAQIPVQLCVDIAALSTLLALTGGAWNPLVPILFVHTVLGAMLLEGRTSLVLFSVLILCLALIQANSHIPPELEGSLLPAVMLFPAQLIIAGVFWILTAWLSRTLTALQQHVVTARERKTRIDRLRAVGALAAGLSHEFATPLNTAQLRLSRLARSEGLQENSDLVTAREELERCGEVLRHMAGSQLEPERLSFTVVDIGDLARQVCSSMAKVYKGLTIHFHTDGRGPRRALVPSVAFSQALINLIENAIESAGENKPIDVIVRGGFDHVDLVVADRGEGWPAMVRNHLGEPFVTTKQDGVGLGLYYVHSLAEAIGAQLTLEDRTDGGAIAHVSLPVVRTGERPNTETGTEA
jgi:two-component system sensor histidine kinase RegB